MNPIFWQIIVGVVLTAVGAMVNIWVIRVARQEGKPEAEIEQLQRDVVVLRGQIKYIQGVLNGKHWKQQEN